MDRREALKATSLFLGYTLTAGSAAAILGGCKAETATDWVPKSLTSSESDLLAEICETILPKTDTPGAKDALCHRYIDELLTNFYEQDDRDHFKTSLMGIGEKANSKFSKSFVALTTEEREEILGLVVAESKEFKEEDGKKPPIFKKLKEATISGYFTSEVGATGGLGKFTPVPGPYQGCIDYASVGKVYVL